LIIDYIELLDYFLLLVFKKSQLINLSFID
jgi:hypothetical protein